LSKFAQVSNIEIRKISKKLALNILPTNSREFRSKFESMKESRKISKILPNLLKMSRPVISGDSPLIVSGNLLQLAEVHVLPIVQGLQPKVDEKTKIKMYATLAGYSVLEKILQTSPNDYQKLIWTHCNDIPLWIGSVNFEDSLDDLLRVFESTGFGDAAVEGSSRIPGLVTLSEILSLYKSNVIRSNLRLGEIGSKKISLPPSTDLLRAIQTMFDKRIRRLFLDRDGFDAKSVNNYISGRNIIRFLFSPDRLEIARKSPELWADATLGDITPNRAKVIPDSKTVNQGANEFEDGYDSCLVCKTSGSAVTRWDMVMKPWKKSEYVYS
jgi:CBS domain-containing protein